MAYSSIEDLVHVLNEYARIKGLSRATVGTYALGSGFRLARLDAGGDLATRTFRKAMQWLSDNWPVDKPWPEGIERLSPSPRDPNAVPSRKRRGRPPNAAKGANDGGTDKFRTRGSNRVGK